MGLQQLIYTSSAIKAFTETQLSFLLLNARKNNQALGVTGILLYDAGAFLQVLEGEAATVAALYHRIERDPRHTRVSKVLTVDIAARSFGEWSMAFVATKDIAKSLPGYSDFLQHRNDPTRAGDLAAKLVLQFRDGRYRQYID
jgi:FAD-dependent sensor of blue light